MKKGLTCARPHYVKLFGKRSYILPESPDSEELESANGSVDSGIAAAMAFFTAARLSAFFTIALLIAFLTTALLTAFLIAFFFVAMIFWI